jgi:DNA polymerase I-like protein with 3'-5' exonuclease and polymerase domains
MVSYSHHHCQALHAFLMKKTFLLIDGSSYLFRAYHALPPLNNREGEPSGAILGVLNMLQKILKEEEPSYLAMVFDSPGKTIRHEWYPDYKANRSSMPDDLAQQIEPLHRMIVALGIPLIREPGIEADDIIGTLAYQAYKASCQVFISSSDKDFAQLLSPHCIPDLILLNSINNERLDREGILEKFGVHPEQIVDYLSLIGDQSDNIPGIPKVGPKTASKWLKEFGNLDNIMAHAADIPGKVGLSLQEHSDFLPKAQQLIRIQYELPLSIPLSSLQRQPQDTVLLRQLWTRYELKSWLKTLPTEISTTQKERAKTEGYSARFEEALQPVLRHMEETGILINHTLLKKYDAILQKQREIWEEEAYAIAGQVFNLQSAKQLRTLFFEVLQWPILEKTKKGEASTAESVLYILAKTYPLAALILKYRHYTKLQSTYTSALPLAINPQTQRIHTHFESDKTLTGRLSSHNPNLQNIPIRTEEGRMIRQAFIAAPGHLLLSLDYAHIELRLMAHFSADPTLTNAFANNIDVHALTASHLFHCSPKAITKEQRRVAKSINFGLIYGLSAFGLSKQLDISLDDANTFIQTYFATYPAVKVFMEKTHQEAIRNGFVETFFKKQIPTPDIQSSSFHRRQAAMRTAINAPLQGSAAEIIKLAMIQCFDWCKDYNARHPQAIHLILQVHDELIFEVPTDAIIPCQKALSLLMQNIVSLSVPLTVHHASGLNWGNLD